MRQLLVSGCQTLTTLVTESIKSGLVRMLFHLSELRGRVKWKQRAFEATLGIAVAHVDELVELVEELLIGTEVVAQAVQETQQDFLLFFQWLVERIRIHTNTPSSSRGTALERQTGAAKSLLNQRRLSSFLQRAALEARAFRDRQPPHSQFRVETTFGNLVSKQLSKPAARTTTDETGEPAIPLIAHLLDDLESKWFAMVDRMTASIARTVAVDPTGCVSLGDTVEEYSFHSRDESAVDAQRGDERSGESDDTEDDEDVDDEMDAVDWGSLASFELATATSSSTRSVMMLGVRFRSTELLLLRGTWNLDTRDELGERLAWEAVKLSPNVSVASANGSSGAEDVEFQGFAFYGDKASGKHEQLAFLLGEPQSQDGSLERHGTLAFWLVGWVLVLMHCWWLTGSSVSLVALSSAVWLYFQPYDALTFTPLKFEAGHDVTSLLRKVRRPLHMRPSLSDVTSVRY